MLLAWSYEGTFHAEDMVKRVARHYGADVQVTVSADAAVLTVGRRTASFSSAPTVAAAVGRAPAPPSE